MVRKILRSKDPSLREISKPVNKIDKKILALIKDLKDTLAIQKDPEGVGLAAPQIGKNLRVFITNYGKVSRVVINPKILEIIERKEGKKKKTSRPPIMEGCLSLPHYYTPLKRPYKVKFKYLNPEGKEVVEVYRGIYAQIIFHEIDHLNGILFVDRALEQKKSLYKPSQGGWEEVEL